MEILIEMIKIRFLFLQIRKEGCQNLLRYFYFLFDLLNLRFEFLMNTVCLLNFEYSPVKFILIFYYMLNNIFLVPNIILNEFKV